MLSSLCFSSIQSNLYFLRLLKEMDQKELWFCLTFIKLMMVHEENMAWSVIFAKIKCLFTLEDTQKCSSLHSSFKSIYLKEVGERKRKKRGKSRIYFVYIIYTSIVKGKYKHFGTIVGMESQAESFSAEADIEQEDLQIFKFMIGLAISVPMLILCLIIVRRYIDCKHKKYRIFRAVLCCMPIYDEEDCEADFYNLPVTESTITLPRYSPNLQENEELLGASGEREGIDVVLTPSRLPDTEPNPYPFLYNASSRLRFIQRMEIEKLQSPRISYHNLGVGRCNGSRILPSYPEPARIHVPPNDPNDPSDVQSASSQSTIVSEFFPMPASPASAPTPNSYSPPPPPPYCYGTIITPSLENSVFSNASTLVSA
ncbi:Schizosaccharomyces specific protein Mug110 [Schizosaccharomyces osmophilus]|uniref:Schizosaccharomyces specific protein Mug110 n=1 Tax=Schizosaccharomyces osmophilus TaxID=2545709 RepID=A0AAF0AWH7_9SCHI|nr:Schizosaccharomyces specific protein Mug110 [Schizosaccharomyces osmophilus]WBW72934.1 Schizosaccharomyces specific protein Mug110 [Schizosaccharomyces osmophilus]